MMDPFKIEDVAELVGFDGGPYLKEEITNTRLHTRQRIMAYDINLRTYGGHEVAMISIPAEQVAEFHFGKKFKVTIEEIIDEPTSPA
jgi:hypothetical protein